MIQSGLRNSVRVTAATHGDHKGHHLYVLFSHDKKLFLLLTGISPQTFVMWTLHLCYLPLSCVSNGSRSLARFYQWRIKRTRCEDITKKPKALPELLCFLQLPSSLCRSHPEQLIQLFTAAITALKAAAHG